MSPPACATMPRGGSANLLKAPTPPGQGITSAKAKVRDGRQRVDGLTTRASSSRAVRDTMRDWALRLLGTRSASPPAMAALLQTHFFEDASLRSVLNPAVVDGVFTGQAANAQCSKHTGGLHHSCKTAAHSHNGHIRPA